MPDSPESRQPSAPTEREPETKPGESLALPYDPAAMKPVRRVVTAPLQPLHLPPQTRSPLLIVVLSAGIILGTIVLALLLSSARRDEVNEFQAQGTSTADCILVAVQDANVRIGPGYEYPRYWILPAGASERAYERVGEAWFRLENGWLPKETVTFLGTCLTLPETAAPIIFDDSLDLPSAVAELNWLTILEENFATNVNQWVETAGGRGASIQKGYLELSDPPVVVYPQESPNFYRLEDAYYAFDLEWIAQDADSEAVLRFRVDGDKAYEVSLRPEGRVLLMLRTEGDRRSLAQAEAFPAGPRLTVGVLNWGQTISIYLNGERILQAEDATLDGGTYALGLQGSLGRVRISRFEIRVPPSP